jgi:ribosomal protein S18 acetylase RimI-like enzyme
MKTEFRGYVIDDDIDAVDFKRVTDWLAGSYWSSRISRAEVEKGARNSSLVVGAYNSDGVQVGYARVASDKTRFAYIMDVFVDPEHRRKGLAGAMTTFALAHPEHRDVYQWLLATHDAQHVYEKVGFKSLEHPERWMLLRKEKLR